MTTTEFSPIRSSPDLLATMPGVLGYYPHDSGLAVVCRDKVVVVTLRFDLDWFTTDYDAVASHLHAIRDVHPNGRVFLLGYTDDRSYAELSLQEAAVLLGEVADMLVTNGERWWSLMCDANCCPSEGRPMSAYSHLPLREELVARVAGPAECDIGRLMTLTEQEIRGCRGTSVSTTTAEVMRIRTTFHRDPCIDEADAVLVAVALGCPAVFTELFETLNCGEAKKDREWLLEVSARTVEPRAPDTLAMLCMASWLAGGGPVLSAALERLARIDECHPVLQLVCTLVGEVVPPETWAGAQSNSAETSAAVGGSAP